LHRKIKICWLIKDYCVGCDIPWQSCCMEMHKRENRFINLFKNPRKLAVRYRWTGFS
jgi:hypothetical protein